MKTGKVFAGHPVDVATGVQSTAAHDVEVGGIWPLIFRRTYSTALLDAPPSTLGQGWTDDFDARLTRDLNGFEFHGHAGERVLFEDRDDAFERTSSILSPGDFMDLRREGERLVVYHWHSFDEGVDKYVFSAAEGDAMRLQALELPSGHGLVFRYDRSGRLSSVRQSVEKRQLFFTYNDDGLLSKLELGWLSPTLGVAHYHYDARRRLVRVTNAIGGAQDYAYDDAGRIMLERTPGGATYRFRYDAEGRCIESSGDNGYKRTRLFYEPGHVTRVENSLGQQTLYVCNELGQVERTVLPNGAAHATRYDAFGRWVAKIGPLGDTTSFAYDDRGNQTETTCPTGASRTVRYDESHQPVEIVDYNGAVWKMRYERGALVEVVDAAGRRTTYTRDVRNEVVRVASPNGNVSSIQVNEGWTEERIGDTYGTVIERKYDIYLNPTELRDAGGLLKTLVYDPLGRLVEEIHPHDTRRRFRYDADGNLLEFVDARGDSVHYRYSAYGDCAAHVDPLGRTHEFTWDGEGRNDGVRNPKGELARFEFDAVGDTIATHHFDGSVERGQYDLGQRLIRHIKRNGTALEIERDIGGNVTRVSADSTELRATKYTPWGAPLEVRTPDSEVTFEYDAAGRVIAETQGGRRIQYRYRADGTLAARSFAGSKAGPLLFDFDRRGRLQSLKTERGDEETFTYDPRDYLVSRKIGPATEEIEIDSTGSLRRQIVYGIVSRTYQYDREATLVRVVDSNRGTRSYTYDAADQLLSTSRGASFPDEYRYDADGNLAARNDVVLQYEPGDRLRQLGPKLLERDPNGNLAAAIEGGQRTRYFWDPLGQLAKVEHSDGTETRFAYDAYGRRVSKEHGGAQTRYFWAGDDLLAEETGERLTEYAIDQAWPHALWEDGDVRHVVVSHQALVQELIDRDGRVVWRGDYDDWGKLTHESGTAACRLRLPGQIDDPETGLHYNRHRYYAPDAAQFISPDPLAFSDLLLTNGFRYGPNTINYEDPLGLKCNKVAKRNSVYVLENGPPPSPPQIVYVGITKQLPHERAAQHRSDGQSFTSMRVVATDLSHRQARNLEGSALFHIQNGNALGVPLGSMLNETRPVNSSTYYHSYYGTERPSASSNPTRRSLLGNSHTGSQLGQNLVTF